MIIVSIIILPTASFGQGNVDTSMTVQDTTGKWCCDDWLDTVFEPSRPAYTSDELPNNSEVCLFFYNNCVSCFDSIARKVGDEEVLKELAKLTFTNKPLTFKSRDFWYSSQAVFGLKEFMGTGGLQTDNYFNSNRIKQIFWAWLIYSNNLHTYDSLNKVIINKFNFGEVGVLINNSNDSIKFDYRNTNSHRLWRNSIFMPVSEDWVKKLEDSFREWCVLLQEKGIQYLRDNKLSPLHRNFRFELQRARAIGVMRRVSDTRKKE